MRLLSSRSALGSSLKVLSDARKSVKKLVFGNEKRAKNVVVALKIKVNNKKNKELKPLIAIGRKSNAVYVGRKRLLPKV